MRIKIIKEKKIRDYTFIDDSLNVEQSTETNKQFDVKKGMTKRDFRLRNTSKINKLKKSKISRDHSMQGHSPVYE